MILGASGPDTVQCSRAGCREDAVYQVNWRNPKIHGIDRVKVWAACAEHVDFLAEFVRSRDFPVAVTTLGETVETVGAEADS
ncbi:hypothetical protein GCM10025867_28310 [Frondihabitans sucicola]|uniref:Acetone carboxylase n=1 Tax=Frondihabitans sucicola TaxID=1268041 RepID=A0ABM8GQ57_9MICO|nr:hypothetical protein [Frondihabitans sucicola]BDZ50590.1 hypothetical protein GCM10025867_28310 [Frondihabitans sucicola]